MSATVGILGASGVYARHLIPRLVARGFRVRALVRRPEAAGVAHGCGADVRVADIFDRAALTTALEGCDVAINLATSLPGPSGRGSYADNDRVRRQGTPIWTQACRDARVARVIQQSIAMIHATDGGTWSDEDSAFVTPADESARQAYATALAMEQVVRESQLDALILRGGLFYGPGTGFDDDWFARANAGKLRIPGDGSAYVSLVHIADMAEATAAAVTRWPSAKTLIICDDRPAQWRELFLYVASLTGTAEPQLGGTLRFHSFRTRNTRAREALGWAPLYSDYRAGLAR